MMFTLEIEREEDGRWIAEIPELPGVMKYGDTREVAIAQTEALALRVLAERIEHGRSVDQSVDQGVRVVEIVLAP